MSKDKRKQFTNHPDFDILSVNAHDISLRIKAFNKNDIQKVKIVKHDGFMDLLKTHEITIDRYNLFCL